MSFTKNVLIIADPNGNGNFTEIVKAVNALNVDGYDTANTGDVPIMQADDTVAWGTGGATDATAIHDNIDAEISAVDEKVAPIGADMMLIEDSEDGDSKKMVQLTNLPTPAGASEFASDVFRINDPADVTSQIDFDGSAIPTATKRTLIMPNNNLDMSGFQALLTGLAANFANGARADNFFEVDTVNGNGYYTGNAYLDGATWKYRETGYAHLIALSNGGEGFKFFNAVSGTAGDAVPWVQHLQVDGDGKVTLLNGTGINEFSTDGTFADDSDDAVPTEKAIGTRIASLIASAVALLMPKIAEINAQTGTTYTILAADNGKTITLSNAAAITLTVPAGLGAGFNCQIIQKGAGQVTVAASGTTVNNYSSHTKTAGIHAACALIADVANNFYFQGETA